MDTISTNGTLTRFADSARSTILSGFARPLISRFVVLSADGERAWRQHAATGDTLHGVVFGNGVLERFADGWYFEIRVETTQTDRNDGLVIGVTTSFPRSRRKAKFEVADEVPNSWSFGYSGQAKAPNRDLIPIPWNPATLKVGDTVGLFVSPEGDLELLVNKAFLLTGPVKVPTR